MCVQNVHVRKVGDVGNIEDDASYGFRGREEEERNLVDEYT
jgi:hypothetical protein